MLPIYDQFSARVAVLQQAIATACAQSGRHPGDVELLPVTKTHPAAAVEYVARFGLRAVGENRVQEAIDKQRQTAASVAWELIGHLQSNKARLAAEHFARIQSVDSEKLVNHLDRAAGELGRTLPVLLQINAGRDPAKFGAELEDAPRLLAAALAQTHLRGDGFMTIAPLGATPAETASHAARTFATLRELRDKLSAETGAPLSTLSMGMSGDFEAAIAAGSTVIRVGTALFGTR